MLLQESLKYKSYFLLIFTIVLEIHFLGKFNSNISVGKIQKAGISCLNFTSLWPEGTPYNFTFNRFPQVPDEKDRKQFSARCQFCHFMKQLMPVPDRCAVRKKKSTFFYSCIINQTSIYLSKHCYFPIDHYLCKYGICFILKKQF